MSDYPKRKKAEPVLKAILRSTKRAEHIDVAVRERVFHPLGREDDIGRRHRVILRSHNDRKLRQH